MSTNDDQPRSDRDRDNIGAVPITDAKSRKGFPWLLLLPLLLLLLLIPFCNRRTTDDTANATRNATDATRNAATSAGAALVNPFTINTTGPDAGKAVLNFDANATTPNANASGVINNVVAYLKANPAARVSLKGYTDSTGTAEVNRRLTEQRIGAVRGALTAAGVDAGRIASANFGEAYAVTDNSTAQAREMNRRVEIELSK